MPKILITLAIFLLSTSAIAAPKKPTEEPVSCKASLLMEAASGEIIEENNAHELLPPASMIKLLVAYTALDQIKKGNAAFDNLVTTSKRAAKTGGSQVYLKEGEQFSLEELLQALLIQSANDAAIAIAEHMGGSVEGFVDLMKQTAAELEMSETELYSPHGLPPSQEQLPDLISATDLAKLGRAIIKNFPSALKYTGTSEAPFRDGQFIMRNHNGLVRTYQGADGLKTGYYAKAGFGVTATAEKNGLRMIAVLMGCSNRQLRDREAARLLTLGFSKYHREKVISKGESAKVNVVVRDGEVDTITPIAEDDLFVFIKPGEKELITKVPHLCDGISAPFPATTNCGSIVYKVGERELGRVKFRTGREVKTASLIKKLIRKSGF